MFSSSKTMNRAGLAIAAFGMLSTLTGCPRPTLAKGARTSLSPPPPLGRAGALGPGDSFEIRVYGEPELTAKYKVGPDGKISVPFCGSLHVDEKTSSEVASMLTACLQKALKDPQVSVLEIEVGSRKKVTVFGYVQKPGTFPYEDRMSIVQAVATAGGFAQFAGQNAITVTRVTDAGEEKKFEVPVKDIGTGGAANFYLLPGDIVYVPESAL